MGLLDMAIGSHDRFYDIADRATTAFERLVDVLERYVDSIENEES